MVRMKYKTSEHDPCTKPLHNYEEEKTCNIELEYFTHSFINTSICFYIKIPRHT